MFLSGTEEMQSDFMSIL